MKAMQQHLASILGTAFVLTVGGCGSESESNPAPPLATPSSSAEGLYSGSTNTNRTLTAVVLDDGTHYFFYSAPANPTLIAGVVQGNGTSNSGSFTSANARDFNIEGLGVLSATITASYAARQSLSGSITSPGASDTTFTSTFDPAYDTTPSLASLAGTYTGQAGSAGGVQSATVTVASNGVFTGVEADGCSFTGTASPRVRGNIFDQNVTFGGAPCEFSGSTLVGIAYLDVPNRQLYGAAPASDRTNAVIFSGTKP
jgi:hypothetical protein